MTLIRHLFPLIDDRLAGFPYPADLKL